MTFITTIILIIAILLVATLLYGVYDFTHALPDPEEYERLQRLYDHNCEHSSDALSTFIIDYLDDKYSEFAPVQFGDVLVTDLGIDSLDLANIMTDISYVTGTELSAGEFQHKHGAHATVRDLIQYVRTKQSSKI